MSYKNTRSYRRLSKDRNSIAPVAAEIKVRVKVTSRINGRDITTTEIGTGFASPLSDKSERDKGTENAVQDAIGKHIDVVSGETNLRNTSRSTVLAYDAAAGKLKFKDYGVKKWVILKRWFRYRTGRGEQVKRIRRNGRYYVALFRNGRAVKGVSWVRGDRSSRANYDTGRFSYDEVQDQRDRLLDD